MVFSDAALQWLGHATGIEARELEATALQGATSSKIFLIQERRRVSQKFVLRVLDNKKWLAEEPDLTAHEAAALKEARKAGVHAPRLIAHSQTDAGFGAPVVLMSQLEGKIELRPAHFSAWLRALAETLAQLHRHQAEGFAWHYSSWVETENLIPPRWAGQPAFWQRAIEIWQSGPPEYSPVFIHRDYHPVNVLWKGEKISGVVDWPSTCLGPAGVDVGHCRVNLALMYGVDAADEFLSFYREFAPQFQYQPYWDLDTIFDWCLPQPEFYEPWREFGLGLIAPGVLRRRVDAYLERVMQSCL